MSAKVIRFPRMTVADARRIIANHDIHDDASVLDACEFLQTYGDWMDHERAKALHTTIVRDAIAHINRNGRIRRWIGDLFGAVCLFVILYLFLIFTPV